MSRNRVFTIIIVLLIFLASCTMGKTSQPKVLFILIENSKNLDFVLKNEIGVMAKMLEEAGYKAVYATASGKSLGTGDEAITPDLKLADVKVKDYAGIVLPCMAVGGARPESRDANRILTEAMAAGKPIASASGAIFSLRDAGVLDGKQFGATKQEAPYMKTGTYMGTIVVQDGNLITSAFCPSAAAAGFGTDQTSELIQKFIDALKSGS